MMRGFTFNGKHSYTDYGLGIESKKIGSPAKAKIKETIPFLNGSYDFSTIGSNGEQVFSERPIQVVLSLPTKSKEQLHELHSQILLWLVDTGQHELIFDDIDDYYFMAEVESAPALEEMMRFGKLTVEFVCEPFKIGVLLQDVEFDVSGTKTVSILNPGRVITPTINASAANMSVVFGGKTYALNIGDNKVYGLRMQNGINNMILNGTGHIEVLFRREML